MVTGLARRFSKFFLLDASLFYCFRARYTKLVISLMTFELPPGLLQTSGTCQKMNTKILVGSRWMTLISDHLWERDVFNICSVLL